MNHPIHIDTISMELSIFYSKGLMFKISKIDVFLSLPDVTFHLNLHCLPKDLFTCFQKETG